MAYFFVFIMMVQLAYGQECKSTLPELKTKLQTIRENPETQNFEPLNNLVQESKKCGIALKNLGSSKQEVTSLQKKMFKKILDYLFEEDKKLRDPSTTYDSDDLLRRAEQESFLDEEIKNKIARYEKQVQIIKIEFLQKRKENKFLNCLEKRDFSDQLPPVRNQSINGWCYAYAAADLLTFKLKHNISPIDLAFGYNQFQASQKSQPASLKDIIRGNGGKSKDAILSREEIGFCKNEDFDLTPNMFERITVLREVEKLETMTTSDEKLLCHSFDTIKKLYHSLDLADFKKILETSAKNEILDNLRSANCKERFKPTTNLEFIDNSYGGYIGTSGDKDLLPDITDELLKSLKEGRIVSIGMDIIDILAPKEGKTRADHVMVVVGNEMNLETGQCEFIVRNSWSEEGCSAFNEQVKCEKGVLRIPQSYLEKTSVNTTEIK